MSYPIVSRLLAILLLATAALKIYGLALDPAGRIGVFSGPEWQVGIFEMEVLLALWLLSGSKPVGAWLTSLIVFSTFAIASFYMGLVGEVSCGCLGTIKVNPWFTFTLDVAILVTIAFRRPDLREIREQPATRISAALLPVVYGFLGIAFMVSLLTGAAYASYGSTQAAIAHLRGERISVSPRVLDMGIALPGETREAHIEVRNWTAAPVRLIGGTSDCSCIVVDDLPVTIAPGKGCFISVKMSPPGSSGAFNRRALLFTDDNVARALIFRLTGQIAGAGN